MKIGIIFSLFNCEKTVISCLESWKKIKENPGENQFVYSCVSARFVGYENFEIPADNTIELVRVFNIMDSHFCPEGFLPETQARGLCLQFLKNQNCDLYWMVDGDEEYSIENINNILTYVNKHPEIALFNICLKNFVFSDSQYLAAPFCPPRIYRNDFPPFKLGKFYEDNGISWIYNEKEVGLNIVPTKTIPKSCAWVSHKSWSDPIISAQKISYQNKRWGKCSFLCDSNGGISFNPFYYKDGKFPEVLTEQSNENE